MKMPSARVGLRVILPICLAASGVQAQPAMDFKGSLLVVASDGDMQAQAYAGDELGSPARDTLSVIELGGGRLPSVKGSVEVTNSVVGPPASVKVSPDGRYAVVIETKGPRPAGRLDVRLKDLPPGRAITVVDLNDPARPVVIQRLVGRENPISVAFRPDGMFVAIAYDTTKTGGTPLEVIRFKNGKLGKVSAPRVAGFAAGDSIKNAAFTPDGTLALAYSTRPRLSLLRVASGRAVTLTRWGNDVPLGRTPFEVRFTPDGRFALVNDMFVPEQGTDVRGTVTSIAIGAGRSGAGLPEHRVVSRARTGVMPEGLAISPDGRFAATTNLERTAYAASDPHQGFFASVTLLRLDPESGHLARVGDYPFAGVIPEAVVFDNNSRFLAVASFDQQAPQASSGSVNFWRIAGDFQDISRLELTPTGVSIPVARGAHSMAFVR